MSNLLVHAAHLSLVQRLLSNVRFEAGPLDTECWVWTASCCQKGYGHITEYLGGKKRRTHRAHIVSWSEANRRGPNHGMTLDHKCRNTKCIRPSHLEEVSRPENTRRGNYARKR